jgi:hypothetical protein
MAALIDESGTHKGSPSLSVAAVVGAHWQWRKFLSYWSVVSVVDSNAGFNIDKRWIANFGSVDRSGSTKELRERTSFGSQSDQGIDTGSATGG